MNKEQFTNQLKERLEEITGCKVEIQHNIKNNGLKLTSITLMHEESNIAPNIYVESYYELFKAGESLEKIIEMILETEEKHQINRNFDVRRYLEFHNIKSNLRFKIINTERNKELLEEIPHLNIMDLSKVYFVEVDMPEIGKGTMLVKNNLMDLWKIDFEELDRIATEMTQQHSKLSVINMKDFIIAQMANMELEDMIDFEMENIPMYAITNQERVFGAACLLYDKLLQEFAEDLEDDLVILPSSTHEVIVLPANTGNSRGVDYLKGMVKEVNSTQVSPEEFLSNNIYLYRRATNQIEIL